LIPDEREGGGDSAHKVPKRRESRSFVQAVPRAEPQEPSRFPPGRTIGRQRPSNVWGVANIGLNPRCYAESVPT
jgi:hypothetical protein